MPIRILTVDDDPEITRGLRKFLEKVGYTVREENDSEKALSAAREFQPHVVILDFQMPSLHGGDVAWQLSNEPLLRDTRIIICSGCSSLEIASKLPPARIPIFEKPIDTQALLKLIAEGHSASARAALAAKARGHNLLTPTGSPAEGQNGAFGSSFGE